MLRIEIRQRKTSITRPLTLFFVVWGIMMAAVLIYCAYNEWFRPLGH